MLSVLSFLAAITVAAFPCKPSETFIRRQWVDAYTKLDGSRVSAHARTEHCRAVDNKNYFQDSTKQRFTSIKSNIKTWSGKEKELVQKQLGLLPPWLSKFHLQEVLRGDEGGHPKNPAMSVPLTRTLIIFDQFFKEEDQRSVIIHELTHIAFSSIDPELFIEFTLASGWTAGNDNRSLPPEKLLLPDSAISIEEDLANHVEIFYANPVRLMTFNYLSFAVIKKIIESKEKEN